MVVCVWQLSSSPQGGAKTFYKCRLLAINRGHLSFKQLSIEKQIETKLSVIIKLALVFSPRSDSDHSAKQSRSERRAHDLVVCVPPSPLTCWL